MFPFHFSPPELCVFGVKALESYDDKYIHPDIFSYNCHEFAVNVLLAQILPTKAGEASSGFVSHLLHNALIVTE